MKALANKLFESREVTHALHLNSKKYSEHIALNEYYDAIVPFIDDLVEVYQGQYELIGDYMSIESNPEMDDAVKYMTSVVDYVKEERYKQIKEEDAHLQAIVDEIVNLQYKTIYKLKYLQ